VALNWLFPYPVPVQVVPTSTKVCTTLELNVQQGCCELVVATNNDCVIRGVIVFAEQLFESESLFAYDPECPFGFKPRRRRILKDTPRGSIRN
jgi:hypothetical protein